MNDPAAIMQTIVFALAAGVVCQLISEKIKVPSIFFLLSAGVLLGPSFANLVRPQDIGLGLMTIIEIGVAIILFEGGLNLSLAQFKIISQPIQRLLSLGAIISFIGATLCAAVIVGLPLKYCFVFGALMVITGPTVIGPVLKRVPLHQNISTILHWESILLDPLGAVLAVLIMEFLLAEEKSFFLTLIQFHKITLVGCGIGFLGGWVMKQFLKWGRSISKETINLMILGGALLTFESAHLLATHSGLVAVVVAGMVLAHGPISQREEIQEFKATLSTLLVGFLFILLAANLNIEGVFGFGVPGWWLLGALIFAIRPLAVFMSMRRTTLKINEKVFLSLMAPRGIVAASTASLFALILLKQGHTDAVQLENLVYLVIVTTVIVEGLPAGLLARLLRVTEAERNGVLIIAADQLGRRIAKWLHSNDIEVKVVDTNFWHVRSALNDGLEAYHGNALDAGFLENLPIQRVGTLLTLTPNNEVNILAAQLGNRILGEGSSYQLMPHFSHQAHELSKAVGGTPIMPHLPYLEEVNPGLEIGTFEWREATVSKGTVYEDGLTIEGGLFWPLFFAKATPLVIIPAGFTFKADEAVIGIFKAATPSMTAAEE